MADEKVAEVEEFEEDTKQADDGNKRSFERMLQKSGRGSIALVLPHSWVDQSGLKIHESNFPKVAAGRQPEGRTAKAV